MIGWIGEHLHPYLDARAPHSSTSQGRGSTKRPLRLIYFVSPRSLGPRGSPLPESRLPGAFRGLHPSNQPFDDCPQRAVPGSQLRLVVRLQQELMAGDRADLGVEGRGAGRGKGLR